MDAYLEVVNIDSECVSHFRLKSMIILKPMTIFMNPTENHLLSISEVTQGNRSCIIDCVPFSRGAADPYVGIYIYRCTS